MSMDKTKFQELLKLAKERAAEAATKEVALTVAQENNSNNVDSRISSGQQTVQTVQNDQQIDQQTVQDIPQNNDISKENTSQVALQKQPGVSRDIILNPKQSEFVERARKGEDIVLIGAAGTGKTTCQRALSRALIDDNSLGQLNFSTRWLNSGAPGCAVVSYTRKAVNNIRHAVVNELKANVLTIHKLLEFQPVWYEIEDPNNKGFIKKTMKFEPARNAYNPLPTGLTLLIFEEASMISVELYNQLMDAMPHPHQQIFLGDIQQLPPVFGSAILGYKMNELPVIELTEVYRQGEGSPIINLAWKLLEGSKDVFNPAIERYNTISQVTGKMVSKIRAPALERLNHSNEIGSLRFQIWQSKLSAENAINSVSMQCQKWIEEKYYNPDEDIILMPFNKSFGTLELNKKIANYLGRQRNALVHEVIAGYNKYYLAVGDRVLYDKEDAFIVDIVINGDYFGKPPSPASKSLDRWGAYQDNLTEQEQLQASIAMDSINSLEAIERHLELTADGSEDENRTSACSHVITIRYAYGADDGSDDVELRNSSAVNNLLGGYVITVHKAQGSEFEKVFYITNHSHAVMNSRELLYTGITRARKHLHIIAEADTFWKGITSQRISGNTIQEKISAFMGKNKDEHVAKHKSLAPGMREIMAKYNNTGRTTGYDERETERNSEDSSPMQGTSDTSDRHDDQGEQTTNRQTNSGNTETGERKVKTSQSIFIETAPKNETPQQKLARLKALRENKLSSQPS